MSTETLTFTSQTNTLQVSATDPVSVVETKVNYLSSDLEKTPLWRDAKTSETNCVTVGVPVKIHDVRGHENDFTFDVHGFMVLGHKTSDENLQASRNVDDELIRKNYYPEMVALLKKLTGAEKVLIFNHIVRLNTPDGKHGIKRQPAGFVHVDHTPDRVPPLLETHVPEEEREMLKKCRFQVINVWRPLMEPVQKWPLAFADYRSLHPEDVETVDVRFSGEATDVPLGQFRHRDAHKWHYLSKQKMDEVLCIKTYETKTDVARYAMHTAFENPLAPQDAPPRESVEVRAIIYYPNE